MKVRAITQRLPMYAIACTLLFGLFAGLSIMTAPPARSTEAIAAPAAVAASAETTAPIVLSDYLGREITLAKPAQRIVALAPHIVENLFSAGLGDRIVATVNYADYPEAARSIPRIGGFSHFSREAILEYRPDLVIGWASGYQGFGSLLAQLQVLGVPVYADDPRHFSDIARSIVDFARLGGVEAPHGMLQTELHSRLARLREANSKAAERPVTVFYEIWHEPLQTLNGAHLVNEAIEVCGGRNVFADAAVLAPTISLEAVLQQNPEVIVASAQSRRRPPTLDNWRRWPGLDAVANEQLYHVHGDLLSRHTLRMLDGVAALCGHIASAREARKDSRVDAAVEALAEHSASKPRTIADDIDHSTSIDSSIDNSIDNSMVDDASKYSNSEAAALANRPGQATR